MEIIKDGKHTHIILDQSDLALNCRQVPFNDVDIHMFPTVSGMDMLKAETVKYRYYIDNPDIPYMTRTLKENIIVHKTKNRGVNIQPTEQTFILQVTPNV
jgi:hypothetical protein